VFYVTGLDVIIAALTAGATAGSTDIAKTVVVDAYSGLKTLLQSRLAGRPEAQKALDPTDAEPVRWRTILIDELTASGADTDPQVLDAARRLLELADPDGMGAGKYQVDAHLAKGIQIGDHNTQRNTFS
jgi:hypothetical protein